jgi:peptidoglycan/xylan/chitin deacetylase (PgdA/CDA1 family)
MRNVAMFFHGDIRGDQLPAGTLCLTYDDGPGETASDRPGPRTRELGRYLADEGIAATFFVVGRHAEQHGEVLTHLHEWGHLVGNHTWSHAGLVDLARAGGDVVGEVLRADRIIAPHGSDAIAFFRPPYGSWRRRGQARSLVADALNGCLELGHYVGPIKWDITGEDYDYWRQGASAEDCARRYLDEIECAGRGIVLMHDSSDEAKTRSGNRALETTRRIVPILRQRGYRFVRLDRIPQVQAAASP